MISLWPIKFEIGVGLTFRRGGGTVLFGTIAALDTLLAEGKINLTF